MAEMLDCLVSYFSSDTNDDGMPKRYISYVIIAGPGPTPEGGVAAISIQAANVAALCETCDRFHAVKSGGPRAALERAVQYLDAWHSGQHLTKVQTAVRCDFCAQQSQGQPEWDEELLVS